MRSAPPIIKLLECQLELNRYEAKVVQVSD